MRRSAVNTKSAAPLLFELSNEGVKTRQKWRAITLFAIWVVLSGGVFLLTRYGVDSSVHVGIIAILSALKYIPMLAVAYNLARKMAALYLDDVFELDNEELASKFLEDVTFGDIPDKKTIFSWGKEKVAINEGRIIEKDERSSIILIGGPGLVQVNLDSVALLEKVSGAPEVIHPRKQAWPLGAFDRIREIGRYDEVGKREYAIINLRDQFVSGLSVASRTKDGIPIEARGIKVIFSILRRQNVDDDKVQGDAYLFEPGAVEALVYNQTLITPEPTATSGIGFPWDNTVLPLISQELKKIITSRTLSEILATIGQKELDDVSNNDQTIAKMRVEMTGQTYTGATSKSVAPAFQSRSKITAQFYDKPFKDKAASLGISLEWIDVGTWELPSKEILEKHKEALTLSRDNAKKSATLNQKKKKLELEELVKLARNVIIDNYEKENVWIRPYDKDSQTMIYDPELRRQMVEESGERDPESIAYDMLKAFRKQLLSAKDFINNENRSQIEKSNDLANIDKALYDINYLLTHWVK